MPANDWRSQGDIVSEKLPEIGRTVSPSEEAIWLGRLWLRDREAFAQLVQAYSTMLTRMAWLYLGHAHSAEDAVQETFLAAWDGIKRKRDETPMRAWLLGILANRCRKHVRSASRRRKRELSAAKDEVAPAGADSQAKCSTKPQK